MFTVAIVYEYDPLGSLNVIVLVVDENDCPLLKLTYHKVPVGSPFSVNVIVYTGVNVTAIFTFAPFTVMVPDDGDVVYPLTEPIEYEYVPIGIENVIVFVVEDLVISFSVTDHDVPDGNPLSVNVTVYVTRVNVIAKFILNPFTVMLPDDGDTE